MRDLWVVPLGDRLTAAPITVTGATLAVGTPLVLFPTHIVGRGVDSTLLGWEYDVAPDGRFLINTVLDTALAPTALIQHWNPDAKQ